MTDHDTTSAADADLHGGRMHVPRSRGALSGTALIVLGAWGALIPFVGPWFSFAYSPDSSWTWTAARGWLEVLPGIVAALGGILMLLSSNRAVVIAGAWLGIVAGVWFVIGRDVAVWLKIGSPGTPTGGSNTLRAVESLAFFSGLGALLLYFAAVGLGRLSVRSVRDVKVAQKRQTRSSKDRDKAYEEGRRSGIDSVLADRDRREPTTQPTNQPTDMPVSQATTDGATALGQRDR